MRIHFLSCKLEKKNNHNEMKDIYCNEITARTEKYENVLVLL